MRARAIIVDALLTVLFYIVLCAVPAILTFVLVKLLDYLRRRDAESQAQGIVARASQEVPATARATVE